MYRRVDRRKPAASHRCLENLVGGRVCGRDAASSAPDGSALSELKSSAAATRAIPVAGAAEARRGCCAPLPYARQPLPRWPGFWSPPWWSPPWWPRTGGVVAGVVVAGAVVAGVVVAGVVEAGAVVGGVVTVPFVEAVAVGVAVGRPWCPLLLPGRSSSP